MGYESLGMSVLRALFQVVATKREAWKNGDGPRQMGILENSVAEGQISWGAKGREKDLPGGEGVDMKYKELNGYTFVELLFYTRHYTKCFLCIFICFNSLGDPQR